MSEKISQWTQRVGRKLRVVFENDSFREYVDLPDIPGFQQQFENSLRKTTGSKISLYRPESSYRSVAIPPLTTSNLRVVETSVKLEQEKLKPAAPKIVRSSIPATPNPNHPRPQIANINSRVRTTALACDHWWEALAAVPSTKHEIDWWATQDGRASRYDRLRRVWWDPTGMDWYYQPHQEDHLTTTLWENLSLFHPEIFLPLLFELAEIDVPTRPILDCCWSYQFEAITRQLCDITLQFRDTRSDSILIIETKKPKNKIKPGSKDANPEYYLSTNAFSHFTQKYFLYLVDSADVPSLRAAIGPKQARVGILTWQQLASAQIRLVDSIATISESCRKLLRAVIAWQFEGHWQLLGRQFAPTDSNSSIIIPADFSQILSGFCDMLFPKADPSTIAPYKIVLGLQSSLGPRWVSNFLQGMLQHQAWWYKSPLAEPVFNYLETEPTRTDINRVGPQKQNIKDRQAELWRLPPRY